MHHRFNGHELERTPRDGKGQGGQACCSPWGLKESDRTWRLNNNSNKWLIHANVWQKPTQYCSTIILQLKIYNWNVKKQTNKKKNRAISSSWHQEAQKPTQQCNERQSSLIKWPLATRHSFTLSVWFNSHDGSGRWVLPSLFERLKVREVALPAQIMQLESWDAKSCLFECKLVLGIQKYAREPE